MTMIRRIEDYFANGCGRCERFATPDCSARAWAAGLAELRRICLAVGLRETVKWGQPCYLHADRNIVILGALRGDFRISFFDAALLRDPERVLEKAGPNTAQPDLIRFTDNAQVAARERMLVAYLREAMDHAAAGTRAPKVQRAIELPAELIAALDGDAELGRAFRQLTPGRQRSYGIALASAKTAATRIARIAKLRSKILAGKGAQER